MPLHFRSLRHFAIDAAADFSPPLPLSRRHYAEFRRDITPFATPPRRPPLASITPPDAAAFS
jgi:hypothetical protein